MGVEELLSLAFVVFYPGIMTFSETWETRQMRQQCIFLENHCSQTFHYALFDRCDCWVLQLHVKKRHHMIQSCKSSELGPHPSYFRCFKTEVWQRLRSVRSSGRWPAWAANERVGQRKAGPQPCYVKAGVGNGRLRKVTSHLSTESGGTWKVSSGTLSSISYNNNNCSIWLCL